MAAPTVTTGAVTSVTSNSASVAANITADGGKTITARGVQFGSTPNADRTVDELGTFSTGAYSESLANLFSNLGYSVRAYATNADGTGYGSWVSFTTLVDAYKITINGVDRTADVLARTLIIEDVITDKQTNCSFKFYDGHGLGVPTTDQEIIITLDSGTKIFGGYIITMQSEARKGAMVIYNVTCVDYTRLMDRNLVNENYSSVTDQALINNIIQTYCQGLGITGTNVVLGVTISQLQFNYVQFSKAMRILCDVTGRNWYIDYNKDIHYFPSTQNPAPFNISDSQTYAADQGFFNLQIMSDASQLKNRVYVRGGTKLSDATTYSTKGDGTKTKFTLPDKPHAVSLTINGVAKTVGIYNIDTTGFDWYLNFEEKYMVQDSGGAILTSSDTFSLTYTYDIPILVAVENTSSIATNGVHEFLITDNTISTTQAARDRASAELTDYANNMVDGQFSTFTNGFRSGQYVTVTSSVLGISATYIVQKVHAVSIGGGKFQYDVYLASAKTLGIIRFLLEMLEANKNQVSVSSNEVLDNLVTLSDSLDPNSITEVLTIDSAGPYRTWCHDSLTAGATRAVWGLFQWGYNGT